MITSSFSSLSHSEETLLEIQDLMEALWEILANTPTLLEPLFTLNSLQLSYDIPESTERLVISLQLLPQKDALPN